MIKITVMEKFFEIWSSETWDGRSLYIYVIREFRKWNFADFTNVTFKLLRTDLGR